MAIVTHFKLIFNDKMSLNTHKNFIHLFFYFIKTVLLLKSGLLKVSDFKTIDDLSRRC